MIGGVYLEAGKKILPYTGYITSPTTSTASLTDVTEGTFRMEGILFENTQNLGRGLGIRCLKQTIRFRTLPGGYNEK